MSEKNHCDLCDKVIPRTETTMYFRGGQVARAIIYAEIQAVRDIGFCMSCALERPAETLKLWAEAQVPSEMYYPEGTTTAEKLR